MSEQWVWIPTTGLLCVRIIFDATLLAAVTWLICGTLLRRTRPVLQGWLWTIVLLKFFIPPVFPGELALSGLVEQAGSLLLAQQEGRAGQVDDTVPRQLEPADGKSPGARGSLWGWRMCLISFYLCGLSVLLVLSLVRWVRARRWLAQLPLAGPALQEQVDRLSRQLAVRCPRVTVTDGSVSPLVFGVIRPTLVVPEHLLEELPRATREALLVHELAHLRRGDLIVRALQVGARTLFFFWPPVWWVSRRIERFAELACDQWAVAESGVEPGDYAGSLLTVIRRVRRGPAFASYLNFARQGTILEERFRMLLRNDHKMSPRLSFAMVPALIVWLFFAWGGGLASSQEKSEPQEHPKHTFVRVVRVAGDGDTEALMAKLLLSVPDADLDGDGVLTREELHEYAAQQGATDGDYFFQAVTPPAETAHSHTSSGPQAGADRDYFWVAPGPEVNPGEEAGGAPALRLGQPAEGEGRKYFFIRRASGDSGDQLFDLSVPLPDASQGLEGMPAPLPEELLESLPGPAGLHPDHLLLEAGALPEGAKEFTWTTEEGNVLKVVLVDDDLTWDSNGDGEITVEEVRAHVEAQDPLARGNPVEAAGSDRKDRLDSFLDRHPEADLNGDGEISREEAEALARRIQLRQQKP